MTDTKFCTGCSTFRPVDEILYEWRRRNGRRIKKVICKHCAAQRDSNKSVEDRDAYGKRITQRNKEIQRAKTLAYMDMNKDRK